MSNRSIHVIRTDLSRTRTLHANLNEEIDALQRRAGLGNSMELQRKKHARASYKQRIVDIEAELAAAEMAITSTVEQSVEMPLSAIASG